MSWGAEYWDEDIEWAFLRYLYLRQFHGKIHYILVSEIFNPQCKYNPSCFMPIELISDRSKKIKTIILLQEDLEFSMCVYIWIQPPKDWIRQEELKRKMKDKSESISSCSRCYTRKIIGWMDYKQLELKCCSSGAWNSEMRAPAWLSSGESPLAKVQPGDFLYPHVVESRHRKQARHDAHKDTSLIQEGFPYDVT